METEGAALVAELERQFVTAVEPVSAGALQFALLKPANGDATKQDRIREMVLQAYVDFEQGTNA